MAIYHCSIKTVSRAKGRSAPAAAAYRAGVKLEEKRSGEVHDFTRKRGVLHTELVFPEGVTMSRSELWNAAEFAETRKNSTVAREYEVALPDELSSAGQQRLARDFAAELSWRYGVAADVCIHEPDPRGDQRNRHAHILTTTRVVTANGFGPKTRSLDERTSGQVEWIREKWATMCNEALEREQRPERVSHLSLSAQGLTREPQQHQGPTATAIQRRDAEPERKQFRSQEQGGGDLEQEISDLGAELEELMLLMQKELRLQLQAAMDQQRLAEAEERQSLEQEQDKKKERNYFEEATRHFTSEEKIQRCLMLENDNSRNEEYMQAINELSDEETKMLFDEMQRRNDEEMEKAMQGFDEKISKSKICWSL